MLGPLGRRRRLEELFSRNREERFRFAQDKSEFVVHRGAQSVYHPEEFDLGQFQSYEALYSLIASFAIAAFFGGRWILRWHSLSGAFWRPWKAVVQPAASIVIRRELVLALSVTSDTLPAPGRMWCDERPERTCRRAKTWQFVQVNLGDLSRRKAPDTTGTYLGIRRKGVRHEFARQAGYLCPHSLDDPP